MLNVFVFDDEENFTELVEEWAQSAEVTKLPVTIHVSNDLPDKQSPKEIAKKFVSDQKNKDNKKKNGKNSIVILLDWKWQNDEKPAVKFLEEFKVSNGSLSPVIVYTSATNATDALKSYDLKANLVYSKGKDMKQNFLDLLKMLTETRVPLE